MKEGKEVAVKQQGIERVFKRVDQMLLHASDDDAFARNHGDGANLTGLPIRDVYELGRSTLLLNLMGRWTAIKGDINGGDA